MKISIFDYMDVRQFLQEFYNEKKQQDKMFSYAIWAEQLGFSNKTILRLIVQGKRSISEKSRNSFLSFFQFSPLERDYFDALIEYTQAKSTPKKQAMGTRLIRLNRQNIEQKIIPADSGILNDVFGPLIVTMLSSAETPLTSRQLADCLGVDFDRMEQVMSVLHSVGLIIKDGDHYMASQATFKISDHFGNESLRSYYKYWIERSVHAIELPSKVRRFRSLQIVLSPEEFEETVQRINEFAVGLLSRFEQNSLENRNLYLLNTALFPVLEKTLKKSEATLEPNLAELALI